MEKVSSSAIINKSLEEVFDFTASPKAGPLFIPNLRENINVNPDQTQVGQRFHWRYDLMGLEMEGEAEIIEFERPKMVKMHCIGDAESYWTYEFERENGSTKVTATVEYDIPQNILSKLSVGVALHKINQMTAKQMLENLKTILES